jgi:hypothetical protein
MIVAGGVLPHLKEGSTREADRQLRLRLSNACLLARSFVDHGFSAVIDDVVAGPRFDDVVEDLGGVPFGFIMLVPELDHLKARWRAAGSPVTDEWDWIDEDVRLHTPHVGLWIDTTMLSAERTVDAILDRIDETIVET